MIVWPDSDGGKTLKGPAGLVILISGCVLIALGEVWASTVGIEEKEREGVALESGTEEHLDKSPVRQVSGLVYQRGGMSYNCMECHVSLEANWHLPNQLMEHRGLELRHGSNRFCLNCHHPENRNEYVDYDGSEIPEQDVVALCAKCHGPQYRDWEVGAHGRRNGYWDMSRGKTEVLICIQCHDPHDPSFKEMKPMAAPTYPDRAAGGRKESTNQKREVNHGE